MDTACKRLLPCKLTDVELAERSQDLAKAEKYRTACERDLSAEAEEWKERKKELEAKILTAAGNCQRLAHIVQNREEDRDVECVAIIAHAQYTLVRQDTGEIVIQRPATVEEMQRDLPLDPLAHIVDENAEPGPPAP